MKQLFAFCFLIFIICTANGQTVLVPGKNILQLKDGSTVQADILFLSGGHYYFSDIDANYFVLSTDQVANVTGKFPNRKDFGGYHQNMLHVYRNATAGAGLLLGGVALAGCGALISAGFDDSQAFAVPMMAIGGVASLMGLVTLTVSLHHGKTSHIKMLAKPYK